MDNKKYYYLKLKENFFESDEMILLQNMQDGYLYTDILMKLYLRSIKNDGKLMFKDLIPYTPSVLAQVLRHQVGTVEKALQVFQKLGLIEVLDNGSIYMLDIQNFIGQSSTEADRIRKYRNSISVAKNGVQMLQEKYNNSTPEIEIEKELDKDIDKKLELEVDKEKKQLYEICNSKGIELSNKAKTYIEESLNNGINREIIEYAISEAVDHKVNNWSYVWRILERYKFEGYKTIEEVKRDTDERVKSKNPKYSKAQLESYYNNYKVGGSNE